MPEVKTDMASVAGDFCSHIGEGSQAVPVAMSQVLRQHKRTRLNRAPEDDNEQSNIKIVISYHSFFCVCYVILIKQGHPTSIFGKYLFGRRFEI